MNRSEIAEDILNREWNLFQQVQNVGGRASCQEDERTFRIMRAAQFEAWNEAMLASYRQDLRQRKLAATRCLRSTAI